MDLGQHIDAILAAGAGVVGSIITWKQGQKTVKASHLDNVEKAIKIWEDTSTRLSNELLGVQSEMKTLKQQHEDCENSKKELQNKVDCLDGKICELTEALHNVIGTPKDIRK